MSRSVSPPWDVDGEIRKPVSIKTRQLADRLFAELQPEHRLDPSCRLILQAAALLHETGLYVSGRSHHKHSMYLILHSDLFGLTRPSIMRIALVARYHRRATPQMTHPEYAALDQEERITISKLAALLRKNPGAYCMFANHHMFEDSGRLLERLAAADGAD